MQNYEFYSLPASDGVWRIEQLRGRYSGVAKLDRLYCLLLGQRWPSRPAYFLVVGFPVLLIYGLYIGARRYRRGDMAAFVTVAFMVANIVYVTLVTTLFSCGDHSRYRFKIDGLYLVFLGMLISSWVAAVQPY